MLMVSCTASLGTQIMPSAFCYSYFNFLPQTTLGMLGQSWDRLVIVPNDDGIW